MVVSEPESPLALTAWAGPLSRAAGEPVVLGATLRDGRAPVAGQVSARLAGPDGKGGEPVALFDDGAHQDGAAGDGVYAARIEGAALAPGFWSVRFDASGEDARGISFERTSSSGFHGRVGRGAAGDGPRDARTRPARGRGRGRTRGRPLSAPKRSWRPLRTRTAARRGVAWAESPRTLAAGRSPLALTIPAGSLGDAASGPLFVDVRLVGLDAPGVSRTTVSLAAR